ncbi:RNA polymerase sigma factor RpoE [Stieleria neptunia]|uniref:RNA polymerase sigma factor RpoE n=1 Tax=Stieleria neptunia TaxID=2527979 RepID=A0A518HSV5_9BACT|nr:sigma-70 family RNA polymerase sigma factor [Stieleria neptunia]QDV43881.1 RNA polymerase sigma factor RpoE [Stieleria neptunia]
MHSWPETRDTLIARLKNPSDRQAWNEFVSLYEPLIFRFSRRRGLQDADACDITQRVLWAVARASDRWEPDADRGRFRGWLATVTRNAVINLIQRENAGRGSGSSEVWDMLEAIPEPNSDLETDWVYERRCELFRYTAARVKNSFSEDVWRAFWMTAVDGQNGGDVAERLGKTIGSVYAARSRVLAKIRKAVAAIEQDESES